MKLKRVNVDLNIKSLNDSSSEYFTFDGFASTFLNIDKQNDVMMPGCFMESLKEFTPSLLWQHDWDEPLGVFSKCNEEKEGLCVSAKMPKEDSLVSGRVMPQMKCGSIRKMSIGFVPQEWTYNKDNDITYMNKVKLYEISLVTIPANPLAEVTGFKSLDEIENLRELNEYLKSYGISNKKCNIIISKLKSFVRDEQEDILDQREADELMKEFVEGVKKLKLGGN